ncbi:MAG: hypothetical protein U9R53_11470 [Chloroflexota bacterium]|nr:hypothetical protein [Chloroflexota bacterium]
MRIRDSLPEINRLSIVSAAIMLAFALTHLIKFPAQSYSFTLFGILLEFILDFSTITTILTIFLAATGMQWLIISHPNWDRYNVRWASAQNWIVPVLTTLVIGVALNAFAGGPSWWVVYLLGSVLLVAVFIAEYNIIAVEDVRHPMAVVGLTALSFALYLLLAIALFSSNLRLYIRLPLLVISAMMVISRSLYLRLRNWEMIWAAVGSLIVSEIAVGLNYLPFTPIQNGMILVGMAYALTSFVIGIKENRQSTAFWVEPVFMLVLMILISFIWG